MKIPLAPATLVLFAAIASLALGQQPKMPAGPGLTLTTTAFADGAVIPPRFTMSDPNAVSPKHDPDAPLQRKVARADLLKAMDGHILGKGVMVGRFHR
jgi:hypothetical protein